jgi:hypothetical protein
MPLAESDDDVKSAHSDVGRREDLVRPRRQAQFHAAAPKFIAPRVYLPFSVSAELLTHGHDNLGVELIAGTGTPGINPHAFLAADRAVARYAIFMMALDVVTKFPGDIRVIGGSKREYLSCTHGKYHAEFHSCMPVIETADALRLPGDCDLVATKCIIQHGGSAVWLSSHSLYYLSPADVMFITSHVASRSGYAAIHDFVGDSGYWYLHGDLAEASWRHNGEMIEMTALGNSTSYRHCDMQWLVGGQYRESIFGGSQLCWSRIRTIGSTSVYHFVVLNQPVVASLPAFDTHIDLSTTVNDVAGYVASRTAFEVLTPELLSSTARAAFNLLRTIAPLRVVPELLNKVMLAIVPNDSVIKVKQDLVESSMRVQVSNSLGNRVAEGWRNNELFMASISDYVRQSRDRRCIVFSLCVGLVAYGWYGPGQFTVVINLALASFLFMVALLGWFGVGRDVLPPHPYQLCWLSAILPMPVALTVELAIGLQPYGPYVNCVCEILFGSWLVAPVHLLLLGWSGLIGHFVWDVSYDVFLYYDVCCDGRPLAPMRPGASCCRGVGDCRPQLRLKCFCYYSKLAFPVVARRCCHNEYIAIRNRVVMVVPLPRRGLWNEAIQTFAPYVKGCDFTPVAYGDWLRRFPLVKRNRLLDKELMGFEMIQPVVNPMLKLEKVLKGSDLRNNSHDPCVAGNVELFDPRVISMRSATYQAYFGPYCLGVSDALRRHWNSDCCITYACGMTLNELGGWFSQTEDHFASPIYFCSDFSRFDAHVSVDALHFQYSIMAMIAGYRLPQCRVDRTTVAYFDSGCKYTVEGTRKSGNSDTTVGNSIINAGFWVAYLLAHGQSLFRLIVMGDDCVVAVPMTGLNVFSDVIGVATQYGFSVKGSSHLELSDVTFCSCRMFPLPVRDYCAALKPGRTIAKSGYALNAPDSDRYRDQWVRALVYSMVLEYAHVPVMRALTLRLVNIVFSLPLCYESFITIGKMQFDLDRFGLARYTIQPDHHFLRVRIGVVEMQYSYFARTYDLSVSQVHECEDWLLHLSPPLPLRLQHPVIDRIVAVDCEL